MDFIYITLDYPQSRGKQPYTADTSLASVYALTALFYHLEKTDTLIMVTVCSVLLNVQKKISIKLRRRQ